MLFIFNMIIIWCAVSFQYKSRKKFNLSFALEMFFSRMNALEHVNERNTLPYILLFYLNEINLLCV